MSNDRLTREEAIARAAVIGEVAYDLRLDLEKGSSTYRGDCTIRFTFTGTEDTFLNFTTKEIERLEVNGKQLSPTVSEHRLALPGAALAHANTVRVVYKSDYDHTGQGLHQFIDPEDGAEYLYTQFEPFAAHRMFPCFDQPDLKATFAFRVSAPAGWEVTSAGRGEATPEGASGQVLHEFEETARFSPYLFSLVAGPYRVVRDSHRGLALGLYCRASVLPYLEAEELFGITKAGMDFFSDFFAQPYPFTKYDQPFVPEFNAGAMENVGNVTYRDQYLFRDPPTRTQKLRRAETLLHELAHMWFGNLVTMRWWDDLWLNESFATLMSYLALERATDYQEGWLAFNFAFKDWAYREDQLPTTHRISDELPSTDEMFLNFDGITYGKGAAVLRQLSATVGETAFRDGVRLYFRRYAWQNATLADFLGSVQEGGKLQLGDWSKLWLEAPSLNTLQAEWESAGKTLTGLRIHQQAPSQWPTLRPHYAEVALIDEHLGLEVVPARIEGEVTEVAAAIGKAKPAFVFPNHRDLAYAKVFLDGISLAFALRRLDQLTDPLLRQLVWATLFHMVRDQQLSCFDFLALVREKLPGEPNLEITDMVLRAVGRGISAYVPEDRIESEADAFVTAARAALDRVPPGDHQLLWARAMLGAAVTPASLGIAAKLIDGVETVTGLTPDQDMRWQLARRWTAFGMEGAKARVEAEAGRDPSDRGKRELLSIETSVPDANVKQEAWRRLHAERYGSLYLDGAAMAGFSWRHQRELLSSYVEDFFVRLPEIFAAREFEDAAWYFEAVFPAYRVDAETIDRAQALHDALDGPPSLKRLLIESIDEQRRALACRTLAAKAKG